MQDMMTSNQKKQILRVVEDELDKLTLSRNAAQNVLGKGNKLRTAVRDIFLKLAEPILKLISSDTSIVIEAVDGTETIPNADDVFSYIDNDFRNYGADEVGRATKETPVNVYEVAYDATFAQMFGSLSNNLDALCLTQAQIKRFCKKHRNWLHPDGCGTFFLFKSKQKFFVANVHVRSGGMLRVYVCRFEYSLVWDTEVRFRVVVPQLA